MKLTTQGLLVIFCPLAFQLLLVAMLMILIIQAQAEFERSIRSEGVVNECNLIVRRIFDGLGAYAFSQIEHEDVGVGAPSVQETRNSFDRQVSELHDLIASDPVHAKADRLLIQEAKNVAMLGKHYFQKSATRDISRRLITVLSMIVQTESEKLQVATEVKTQQRNEMKMILLCFALFGIIVSALVAAFCALRLRKLIAHMTDNAGRFSRREPLSEMLLGTDEVARVDQVFHAMDRAIEDTLLRARALIDNAADLVCSIDRNGYFERVNRFSLRLLGCEPSELIGKSVIDLVIAEDCAIADEQINKSFSSETGNQFELRLKTIEERVIDTSWSTFWSEADSSLFCVVGDVTEHKNIERLKQDFIGMISHDLRTPLMSVASSIALVHSGALGTVSEGVVRDLEGAEKTVDRLIAMINDLLDFEKMDAGKMQFSLTPVAIDDVVSEAFREVRALAEPKGVALETVRTSQIVLADQEKLMQMLINLLANAIRYSPPSGVVAVRCTERDQNIEVAVLDDGPGVPKEFQETVFAPFENAPGSKQTNEGGTGLGLAICKLIIEGHHGQIGVRNRVAGGSEFWFTVAKDVSLTSSNSGMNAGR